MNLSNLIIRLLLLLSLLFAATGTVYAATGDGLVPVPPLKAHVTDLTGTLTATQVQALDAKLMAFENASGSQVAVLIVPTTKPEEIEQYSIRVVDQWKLGRKKIDDGVLLLIAKDDRKLRIEVGYGLEGAIPDAIVKRIVSDVITPYFKNGDFYGGINAGTDSLIRIISGESLTVPGKTRQTNWNMNSDAWIAIFFAVIVFVSFLQKIFGKFIGSAIVAGIVGVVVWAIFGIMIMAVIAGIIIFILSLIMGGSGGGHWGGGGWSSGGGGGSSWGGGGGGGFGGGGASGSW